MRSMICALLATLLAQRGWQVDVYEQRSDPRVAGYAGGRSINLALAERGLHALKQAGLDHRVLEQAVMMRGRFVHPLEGEAHLQRYGRDDSEVIWSISRGELNITLLNAAERAGVHLRFDQALKSVDFKTKRARFDCLGGDQEVSFTALIGADGAGSSLRGQMHAELPFEERTGLRLMPVDVQQDAANLGQVYAEMDQFAQEERAWNPFLVDFYMPTYSRDEFYRPR